jgi:hypothetical protein
MPKKEIDSQERERTNALNQIKRLEEIIATIKSTSQALNKRVTELSGILREKPQSKKELPKEEIEPMFIMLDLSLKGAATLKEIHASLSGRLIELKNSLIN